MAIDTGTAAGPRLVNGTLKWFEGDTFVLIYTVKLYVNDSTEPYVYEEGDKLVFSFYENKSNRIVYSFIFDEIPSNNTVNIVFSSEISKRFKSGLYSYVVKYMRKEAATDAEIITVGARYKVEVLKCQQ